MCVPVRAHISSRVRPALGRMVFEPRCVISSPPLLPPPHLMGNRCCQGTIFPDHIPHLLFCSPREVVVPTRTRAHPPTPTASPSARLQASLSPTLLTVLGARGKFTKTGLIALKMDTFATNACVSISQSGPARRRTVSSRPSSATWTRHITGAYPSRHYLPRVTPTETNTQVKAVLRLIITNRTSRKTRSLPSLPPRPLPHLPSRLRSPRPLPLPLPPQRQQQLLIITVVYRTKSSATVFERVITRRAWTSRGWGRRVAPRR